LDRRSCFGFALDLGYKQRERVPACAQSQSPELGCLAQAVGSADVQLSEYDVYIMMVRTQIKLEAEMQRRARTRANELGVSLGEYFRRLVARDLTRPKAAIKLDRIFDLGNSGGSDIAKDKDSMIAESLDVSHKGGRRPRNLNIVS
jgi:hypothetical protein